MVIRAVIPETAVPRLETVPETAVPRPETVEILPAAAHLPARRLPAVAAHLLAAAMAAPVPGHIPGLLQAVIRWMIRLRQEIFPLIRGCF